jgi:transposase
MESCPLLASAFVTSVADPGVFRTGGDLAAWIGLVPKQNSSGGKERLGGISRAGNSYLRPMLVVGAMAGRSPHQAAWHQAPPGGARPAVAQIANQATAKKPAATRPGKVICLRCRGHMRR